MVAHHRDTASPNPDPAQHLSVRKDARKEGHRLVLVLVLF